MLTKWAGNKADVEYYLLGGLSQYVLFLVLRGNHDEQNLQDLELIPPTEKYFPGN